MAAETNAPPHAPESAGAPWSAEREQQLFAPVFGSTLQDGSLRLVAILLGVSVLFGTLAFLLR